VLTCSTKGCTHVFDVEHAILIPVEVMESLPQLCIEYKG
jgi:hypothetical protein